MSLLDETLLVCPTRNPGDAFNEWLHAYQAQSTPPGAALIIDSESDDGSLLLARDHGFTIKSIPKREFNHGGTRQLAIDARPEYDFIVFLTQDAILADSDSLQKVLVPFKDERVGAVCGRQLPRKSAKPIEAHARLYNYPAQSYVRAIEDATEFGLKTAFLSNSFAAYRASVLRELGGFPKNVIYGEDMYVAARMLESGYKIAYAADACVYHSHDYSFFQEIMRYFDMGVFHGITELLGKAEGEGKRFVASELRYLLSHGFWRIPEALLRDLLKYAGFRLGLMENRIPLKLKRKISMNPGYFKTG